MTNAIEFKARAIASLNNANAVYKANATNKGKKIVLNNAGINPCIYKGFKRVETLTDAQVTRIQAYVAPLGDSFFDSLGNVGTKVAFRIWDFMLFCATGDTAPLSATSLFAVSALGYALQGGTDKATMYDFAGAGARYAGEASHIDPMLPAKLKRALPSMGANTAPTAKSHATKSNGLLDVLGLIEGGSGVPSVELKTLNRAIMRDFIKQVSTLSDYTAEQLCEKIKKQK